MKTAIFTTFYYCFCTNAYCREHALLRGKSTILSRFFQVNLDKKICWPDIHAMFVKFYNFLESIFKKALKYENDFFLATFILT
jgi:hypothetical protein